MDERIVGYGEASEFVDAMEKYNPFILYENLESVGGEFASAIIRSFAFVESNGKIHKYNSWRSEEYGMGEAKKRIDYEYKDKERIVSDAINKLGLTTVDKKIELEKRV